MLAGGGLRQDSPRPRPTSSQYPRSCSNGSRDGPWASVILSPKGYRAARRARVGLAGTLQVQEAREGALASSADAKTLQDRDGDRAAGEALPGQEGAGSQLLAPLLPL